MSPIKSTLAMLFALGSASVLAQNQATLTPTPSKPADSATYGPVLGLQPAPAPAAPPAAPVPAREAHPQAQEERAGQPPAGRHDEVDPSARPAPQAVQPQGQQGRKPKPPDKKVKQAVRRSVDQRIESTPRIAAPPPPPAPRVQVQAAPRPSGPSSSQVLGCVGSNCTDTSGAGYNAGGPGNAAVSSSGQLCTRNGATMQCF